MPVERTSRGASRRRTSWRRTWIAAFGLAMACATSKVSRVSVISSPLPGCRFIGDVEVDRAGFSYGRHPAIEREIKKSAEDMLREKAGERGATHLIVRSVDTYGTSLENAKASGNAYVCPD